MPYIRVKNMGNMNILALTVKNQLSDNDGSESRDMET